MVISYVLLAGPLRDLSQEDATNPLLSIALRRRYTPDASGLWPGKVVTEVSPAGDFWEAEPEHQDYLLHYPNGYTCHFVRPNWVLPARSAAV